MNQEVKVIEKPWGREELFEKNDKYMMKKLVMKKGYRCSLQYHEKKKETVYVESGKLKLLIGHDKDNLKEVIMQEGDTITISPGQVHRMEAIEESVYLEASTPELDDVVRLKDDYERL